MSVVALAKSNRHSNRRAHRIQRTPHSLVVPDLRRMRVDLRCLHIRMTQQLLQRPDIRPALRKVRRVGAAHIGRNDE